jgi:flavorubredoxin
VIELGKHRLQFQTIPMVHWPETMVTYEETNKILFSGDAFGSYGTLDGGIFDDEINLDFYEVEVMRYFTNIVGKYCPHTQRAIKKLAPLDIKMIAATHGPVWRSNLDWVLTRYNKWSSYDLDKGVVIVYGSMYGYTQKMAEVIARRLAERGIKNIGFTMHPKHMRPTSLTIFSSTRDLLWEVRLTITHFFPTWKFCFPPLSTWRPKTTTSEFLATTRGTAAA